MDKNRFTTVDKAVLTDTEPVRESLTYWQDAWRRLRKHKPAIGGLVGVILIVLFGFVGPWFTQVSYSDQTIDYANLPPPAYSPSDGRRLFRLPHPGLQVARSIPAR
jgi:oligopeptide transport system permease protein